MHCVYHIQKEAAGSCVYCGKLFCTECLVDVEGRYYCKEHVAVLISDIRKKKSNFYRKRI